MELFLVENGDDGHDREIFVMGALEDGGIGSAGDQAVLVDLIPGRDEQIDLRRVSEEGANGVGIISHVKEGDGLGGVERWNR